MLKPSLKDLLKKANGIHFPSLSCSRTAPAPRSLASVVRAVRALRLGWRRRVAEERADFAVEKVEVNSGVHWRVSVFFFPAMALNSGPMRTLMRGMNLL